MSPAAVTGVSTATRARNRGTARTHHVGGYILAVYTPQLALRCGIVFVVRRAARAAPFLLQFGELLFALGLVIRHHLCVYLALIRELAEVVVVVVACVCSNHHRPCLPRALRQRLTWVAGQHHGAALPTHRHAVVVHFTLELCHDLCCTRALAHCAGLLRLA